jgi:hypothetical protein
MDPSTRSFMESRFRQDFSDVRVHADPQAVASAEAVHARAYTVGRNIVFGSGQFAPATPAGRRLLAHELTHVVQQSNGGSGLLQRQPKSGQPTCNTADIAGTTFTLHCTGRNFSGKATHNLSPGSYDFHYDGTQFRVDVELAPSSPPKVLSVDWRVKTTQQVKELRSLLDSIKGQKLHLNVSGSGTGGSLTSPDLEVLQGGSKQGTGTGTGAGEGSGEKATNQKEGKSGGTGESGTGTTRDPQKPQQNTGTGTGSDTAPKTGSTGTTQQGTDSPGGDSNYPARLQSLQDPSKDAPKLTDDQSRRLKAILDQLSDSDIALFKQFSMKNPGGDPERLINSLKLFQSAKAEYEKQNPPTAQPDIGDEATKALTSAMDQYRDDMTEGEKEQLARATIASVSNKQLKNLTAKQIAEGIVRVDQQVASMADDMSKGIDQVQDADSSWGQFAGGARAVKGAASWWAFLSFAALIVAQFVPGLNVLVNVLAASALAAGMVVFVAADAEREWNTKAASKAKSAKEFQTYVLGGVQARNAEFMAGAGLALIALGGIIRATPLGRGIENVGQKLNAAKALLGKRASGSLAGAKALALQALEDFRTQLHPYAAQARQVADAAVKRLQGLKGAEFLKGLKSVPELKELLPDDRLKGMEQLSDAGLDAAKTELIADLPRATDAFFNNLDVKVNLLKSKVQNAGSEAELASILDEGVKAVDPKDPVILQSAGADAKAQVVKARIDDLAAESQQPTPKADPAQKPATQQTQAPAKTTGDKPKVEKAGSQTIDPVRRDLATAKKERLETEIKDAPGATSQRARDIKTLTEELTKLEAEKKPLPDALRNDKDYRNLPRLGDEMATNNRLEALRELRQKLADSNKLPPEVADYLNWEEKRLTLKQEIQGNKEANTTTDTRVKQQEQTELPKAEEELRKASQSVKSLVQRRGENFNKKKDVTHDEVMGKDRWDKQQASDQKVQRIQKGKKLDPLDTDHLVPLDRIANMPQLSEFLRLLSKASQSVKDLMLDDLAKLGDIPTNLKRMRWDANNFKNNRSWNEITYQDAKRFGYEAADVDAMRVLENAELKTILEGIAKLTEKYKGTVETK